MEHIYESLFSCGHMFSEQAARWIFEYVPCDSVLVAVGNPDRRFWFSNEGDAGRTGLDEETLGRICARIDDGCDPAMIEIEAGCVIGSELYTEARNAGYVVVVLKGYSPETAHLNTDLFELLFSQLRLVCTLLEKNNQFHQFQLNHLSRSSTLLSTPQF